MWLNSSFIFWALFCHCFAFAPSVEFALSIVTNTNNSLCTAALWVNLFPTLQVHCLLYGHRVEDTICGWWLSRTTVKWWRHTTLWKEHFSTSTLFLWNREDVFLQVRSCITSVWLDVNTRTLIYRAKASKISPFSPRFRFLLYQQPRPVNVFVPHSLTKWSHFLSCK